jgi:hypothetical protein
MLPSKSQFAFEESAKQLFKRNKQIYFWTFTFVKVPWCDTWAMQRWHWLMRGLTRHFPELQGLRVCELHASHGIHFHAIINTRVLVDEMKRLAEPLGFGRLSVKLADIASVTYLSKYLTKAFMENNPSFGFRRRWGTIGGFKGSRCKDMVYDTPLITNRKLLFEGLRIGYAEHCLLRNYSTIFGPFEDWPLKIKINFTTVMQSYGHKKSFV